MMKNRKLYQVLFLTLFGLIVWNFSQAQEQPKVDHSYKPLTVKLSEDGKKYVRFIIWHQIWATTNNLAVDDAKFSVTPSIRRSRFLAFAQVSPRFLILTHFGLNGLTPNNLTSLGNNGNAPQIFLHGAWTEFMLNKSLYIGGGLHYWKGMTRMSNASTLNFMTLDQSRPFVGWHSLGYSDQFARHLGIYAKGNIGKFDYRVAWNQSGRNPLNGGNSYASSDITYSGASIPDKSGDAVGRGVIEGYFRYNFLEAESIKLPYAVGTYLGGKKVFGIGAGFFSQPSGALDTTSTTHVNVNHFALDAFLDYPTAGGAVNAYAAFMSFDYGENYVGRWSGTGTAFYGHIGYFIKAAKIMPYVGYQLGAYEGLEEGQNMSAINIGVNYFILGHNAKLTLEYHGINNDLNNGSDISQIRLQAHIFL